MLCVSERKVAVRSAYEKKRLCACKAAYLEANQVWALYQSKVIAPFKTKVVG